MKLLLMTVMLSSQVGNVANVRCQTVTSTQGVKEMLQPEPFAVVVRAISSIDSKTGLTEPGVAVLVENRTDVIIPFPDVHIRVERNGLEIATTVRQRQLTHKLNEGEAEVREGGYQPGIQPGGRIERSYRLSDLYQMSERGTYQVQVRVAEEAVLKDGKWVPADRIHWHKANPVEVTLK